MRLKAQCNGSVIILLKWGVSRSIFIPKLIRLCYIDNMNWRIEYYIDSAGDEPVRDFVDTQSDDAQTEIFHVIGLLEEFALNLRYPYVEKIGKTGIRELRIHHSSDYYRIFYFAATGRKFILLHAFLKKTRKIPNNEIALAIKRINDYKLRQ